jgi:hypothetical protein
MLRVFEVSFRKHSTLFLLLFLANSSETVKYERFEGPSTGNLPRSSQSERSTVSFFIQPSSFNCFIGPASGSLRS